MTIPAPASHWPQRYRRWRSALLWPCRPVAAPTPTPTPAPLRRARPTSRRRTSASRPRVEPYLPLVPGTQSVREGTTEVGGRAVPHQVTTTVTDVYRKIGGVKTVAMLDHEEDGGQVTQISLDYVAEDKAGNVWNFGGYTEEYEGGRFVTAIDPWLDGVNGAKAGILVQADPKTSSPVYSVAQPDSEEQSVAEVIEVGVRHCVPFDCFNDVLIVREGKASAPDNEFKYYARDVGQIDNVPRGDSVHQDIEKMVNLNMLSPAALAEISKEALRVDSSAPEQAPEIYGGQPVAKRG